jgi:hypothetical protein
MPQPESFPDWYLGLSNKQLIIGYGVAQSSEQAYLQAQIAISQQIRTDVTASTSLHIETSDSAKGTDAVVSSTQKKEAITKVELKGLIELRYQIENGWHFIALGYRNSSLIDQLAAENKMMNCSSETKYGYLKNTVLADQIIAAIGCWPRLSLNYFQSNWYLINENNRYLMSSADLAALFVARNNMAISISSSVKQLDTFALYKFNLMAEEAGYLSLIQIAADGTSQVLINRQPIEIRESVEYPNASLYSGLQASKVTSKSSEKMLTIAALCDEKINFDWLPLIGERHQTEENKAQLPGLLKQLENCRTSSFTHTLINRA